MLSAAFREFDTPMRWLFERAADSMCFAQTAALWKDRTEVGSAGVVSAVFRAQTDEKSSKINLQISNLALRSALNR